MSGLFLLLLSFIKYLILHIYLELYPAIRFYSSPPPEALLLRGSRFYRG